MSSPSPRGRSKPALLFKVLLEQPAEFRDRVLTFTELQLHRLQRKASPQAIPVADLLAEVGQRVTPAPEDFWHEEALRKIEEHVQNEQWRLQPDAAFELYHDAEIWLGKLCYAICRAVRPRVVLETGVGYGVTTAFILQSLAVNGEGRLWSVDLPPLAEGADEQCGWLVPQALRSRWKLVRGRTRRVLPQLLSEVAPVDVFLHDSLHTYRNMLWEFGAVWQRLRPGGVLISDDVQMNRAFTDFSRSAAPALAVVGGDAGASRQVGLMVKAADESRAMRRSQ